LPETITQKIRQNKRATNVSDSREAQASIRSMLKYIDEKTSSEKGKPAAKEITPFVLESARNGKKR
jgi:hypothetical protein